MGKKKDKKIFNKISKDGKITKSEAKKAVKKGVSLSTIERLRTESFREAQRSYQNTPTERRGPDEPTYKPLKISSGASKIFKPKERPTKKKSKTKQETIVPTSPKIPKKLTKPTTPSQEAITSLTKSLQKQLENLNQKYKGTSGQLSTIKGALKQQQKASTKAARKTAKAAKEQYRQMQSQYAAKSAAAQEMYNQQLTAFNEEMLAQQEAFDEALFLRDQSAEQYRLAQEQRAAELEEQQRLQRERQLVGEKTFMANQMRAASADPRFKIGMQSPGGETYGTSQFKRREDLRPTIFRGIQASTIPTIGGINI